MSKKADMLTAVPRDDLTKLRDLYLVDWPRNLDGYYTLDNYIRWLEKESHIKNLSILTLNDDWSDGTFLVIDRYQLFPNTLSGTNERLTIALALLDWSNGYIVSNFLERHRPAVLSTVESKQLQKEYDSLTLVYHVPRDEAIQMETNCPDGMVLRELQTKDAIVADSVWPKRHVGSLFFVQRLVERNPNVGVFVKDSDELVAWCLRSQAGVLGVLQVKDSHQRMGLGGVVLRAISKKIGLLGHDVTACVVVTNTPSRKLFEKCGFKVINKTFWLRTYPMKSFTWSDD